MEHDAANELAVEGNHVPRERVAADLRGRADKVTACVFHESESLRKDVIEGLAPSDTLLELRRHAREILVREILGLIFRLYAVDLGNDRLELLELTRVFRAKYHLEYVHFPLPSNMLSNSATSIPDFSRDSSLILSILSSTVCQ